MKTFTIFVTLLFSGIGLWAQPAPSRNVIIESQKYHYDELCDGSKIDKSLFKDMKWFNRRSNVLDVIRSYCKGAARHWAQKPISKERLQKCQNVKKLVDADPVFKKLKENAKPHMRQYYNEARLIRPKKRKGECYVYAGWPWSDGRMSPEHVVLKFEILTGYRFEQGGVLDPRGSGEDKIYCNDNMVYSCTLYPPNVAKGTSKECSGTMHRGILKIMGLNPAKAAAACDFSKLK